MMTTEQSRKLMQDYIAAFNQEISEETMNQYIADKSLIEHIQFFNAGIPNYKLTPEDLLVDGNKVALRATVEGVHKGTLFGIEPTGNKIQVEAIIIYELDNNKVVNHWMQVDSMALMQQLNAMPASTH